MFAIERSGEFRNELGEFMNRPITVDAVLYSRNKILLIQRLNEPCKGDWALPGGYLNWGETPQDAVVRELFEETHKIATRVRFINIYGDPARHPSQAVNIAYLIVASKGRARKGDDAGDLKWFSINKLPPVLAFDHMQILRDAGVISKLVK